MTQIWHCRKFKFRLDHDAYVNSQNCIADMFINLLGEYIFELVLIETFFFLLCSQDKDANDKDNKKVFSIPVKFEADVEIRGYIFV